MQRKLFVPSTGGFARYLEILSNSGTIAQTVTVTAAGYLGSETSTRVVVAPSDNENTFAVTDQDGLCCDPTLAHVFAGPGAAVGASAVQFIAGDYYIQYAWEVTIPAGETRVLMHFAVQRDLPDTSGATTQAQALRSLTDPSALAGMSAAERAAVVNFVVP